MCFCLVRILNTLSLNKIIARHWNVMTENKCLNMVRFHMLHYQLRTYMLLNVLWNERNWVLRAGRRRTLWVLPKERLFKHRLSVSLLDCCFCWIFLCHGAYYIPLLLSGLGIWEILVRAGRWGGTLEAGQQWGEECWCGNCGVGSGFNFSGHSSDDDWLLCSPRGRLTTSPPIPLPPLKADGPKNGESDTQEFLLL